ncbi:MAG: Uma2 family endonuclease [Planctomycetia bacterium]|nr:Uma2 family endonuclease [Planctomycetia bacterium]
MADDGQPSELVRGDIVMMPRPGFHHGYVCIRLASRLTWYVEQHDLGRVIGNEAAVVTARDPDTVRGPDISFYSYSRVPKGISPEGSAPQPPEIVFEVRSPSDRWTEMLAKAVEYLKAGVNAVVLVDPASETVSLFHGDQPVVSFSGDDELRLPPPLDGFSVPVSKLFE